MLEFLGPALGAVSSLIGGSLQSSAQRDANAAALADKEKDRAMQREFAQQGIRWKVDDAKAAGIHPLYALGANTVSYAPSSVGIVPETGLASGISSAGQDISRAINATRTAGERDTAYTKAVQQLSLEKGSLENQLLASQIAKLRSSMNPAMPALTDSNWITGQPATRSVNIPGLSVFTPGNESQQQKISDEYGDEGLPQIPGQIRFVRDTFNSWMKKTQPTYDANIAMLKKTLGYRYVPGDSWHGAP